MKLLKYTVSVIFLFLVVETQCGLIDNLYGKVKNATGALTQDVKNVWSLSKSIVGLEGTDKPEEEKKGVIYSMIQKARDTAHSIRNYIWNSDDHTSSPGLINNIYNHAKNKLLSVKGTVLGDNNVNNTNAATPPPMSENTKLVKDTLNKLFFKNGTRSVNARAFKEAIENLRKKLHEVRRNITDKATESPVHDGEGLIDIRFAVDNIQGSVNRNTARLNNDIYDKASSKLNEVNDKTAESYKIVSKDVGKGVDSITTDVDNAARHLNKIKDKVCDATARENELMKNLVDINGNAQSIGSKVNNGFDDFINL